MLLLILAILVVLLLALWAFIYTPTFWCLLARVKLVWGNRYIVTEVLRSLVEEGKVKPDKYLFVTSYLPTRISRKEVIKCIHDAMVDPT